MDCHEFLPGLWRVRLPLPFELNHVYVHLVAVDDGWILMDTGLRGPKTREALDAALAQAGIPWTRIRRILLTHVHPDHLGNAAAWKQEWNLPLALHRADQELLAWLGAHPGLVVSEMLETAGAPPELAEPARAAFVELRTLFLPLQADALLEGGEVIPTALGPMEAIWTPGHCAGHLCFYLRDSRTLIAGDHLLNGITPNIPWRRGGGALRDYLDSLTRIAPYAIDWIAPSHGQPFQDHQTWISETRRHHEQRTAALVEALAAGPRTAHELLPALWRRTFSPFHYRFALDEALAHLEYARGLGELEIADPGPPVLWRKRKF